MNVMPRLARNVFLPLALWKAGELAQLRYLREFERTQYLPPNALRNLQWQRLHTLLDHAYENCPFYRNRFEQVGLTPRDLQGLEDLRRLPTLEKRDIQEQGGAMVARNWPKDDLISNQTGGSTGTPISFYLSGDRKCSRAAATLRHNAWAGWDFGDSAAVLWGAPRDKPSDSWRGRLRQTLLCEPIWLDAGHITEQKLADFHATLLATRPKVLLAYAKAIVLFAKFLESRGLRAHQPKGIITSAEILEADERALLERVFGCRVFNRYGCREVSVLASECAEHNGLHVMAEGLYLEIETPTGPAKPGEVGSILVTDLLNLAMPLIRYRIGDMGSWAPGACLCGRGLPRLQQVTGRVTDFVVGDDGRLVSGVFLATYVVAQRPSLGQVQILQEQRGELHYRIKPGSTFDADRDVPYLVQTSREHVGPETRVSWALVEELPREPSGKFLFSKSTVAPFEM